jgi:hypothetical protein
MRRVELCGLLAAIIVASTALTAGAAPKAPKQEPEKYLPIHAVLSVRGTAIPDEFCTAHGFIVVWEGDLEATDDDPEGIFPAACYERFDAPFATLKFDDWACGEGEGRSTCTHKLGRRPSAAMSLVLVGVNRETGESGRTQFVAFDSFELGYIHCSDVVTEPMAIIMDAFMGPGTLVPPLALTEEDFEQGFNRTYQLVERKGEENSAPVPFSSGHDCDYRVNGTLTLSYKQDTEKPKVEIAGCAHLLLGGSDQLTATGTPSGGRYRWTGEPSAVLNVSGTESSTDVKAGEPGHATVRVEYEARNGKKAEATLSGSVVQLTSVNGGAAIPTIYLYDEEGHARQATAVPIAQAPPDGELLFFAAADLSVATVENTGSSLTITGKHEGTTTAQAETKCGEKTGPVLALNVANCSPETIAKLRERSNEVKSKLNESASRVNKVLNSKDYSESVEEIDDDAKDVVIKSAGMLSVIGGVAGQAVEAVETAGHIVAAGADAWEVSRTDLNEVTAIKYAVTVLAPGSAGTIMTIEYVQSIGKLVKHARTLAEIGDKLTNEQIAQNRLSWEFEHINALIEKCKKGSEGGQPSGKEPAEPKPKVEPPAGKKGGDKPKPGEPPTPTEPGEPSTPTEPGEPTEPGGTEPPKKPPIEKPPEPPAKPGGGTVGLPIDCGCKEASTAAWRNEETGLAAIAASLGLLQACAENYENELKSFQADSAGMTQTRSAIETALDTPGEKGFKQFSAAVPGLEAAAKSWEGLSKAATEFSNTLEGCDKKLPEATALIKKAGQTLGTTTPETKSK